jgi:catechol 2,3-dioxygenase-like lactoylglutathione lyase family enzyme
VIIGVHATLFTPDADALRAFFRDTLGPRPIEATVAELRA